MAASTLVNITISVPNGTVTHDDGHVLCVYGNPWRTTLYITTFFLVNYAAHAATIKSNPGDRTSVTICNMVLALFFPVSGLMRALNAIIRFGRWGGSDLEKACRAGALCMVVRVNGWLPAHGQTLGVSVDKKPHNRFYRGQQDIDEPPNGSADHHRRPVEAEVKVYRPSYAVEESSTWLFSDVSGGRAYVDTAATKVHGTYSLPQGYGFAILPRNTRLVEWMKTIAEGSSIATTDGNEIAYTYSMAKAAISIIQSFAALTILLGHRQDVVHRWGYASFHLTILPYLIMTIFNFFSNICTADYDGLYMIETPVMDEARTRGGLFAGTVAGTYTATTFGSEALHQMSGAELRSHHGSEQTYLRRLAQKLAGSGLSTRVDLLKHLCATKWSNMSATCTPDRATAFAYVDCPSEATISTIVNALPHVEHSDSDTNLQSQISHAQSLPPSSPLESVSTATIQLLTDTGLSYVLNVPTIPPSLVAAVKSDLSTKLAANLWYQIIVGIVKRIARGRRKKEAQSRSRLGCKIKLQFIPPISTRGTLSIWNILRNPRRGFNDVRKNLRVSLRMGRQTKSSPAKPTIIYVPACYRFLRGDDVPDEINEQKILVTPHRGNEDQKYSKSGHLSVDLPVRPLHHVTGGILSQICVGTTVVGMIIVLVGWQSHWFKAGEASSTQRIIILLWMSEGIFGMMLTFLSLSEIVLTFFVLPVYVLLYPEAFSTLDSPTAEVSSAFVPFSIFVAPVWGFVIVGKMLAEWGQCVTLYH